MSENDQVKHHHEALQLVLDLLANIHDLDEIGETPHSNDLSHPKQVHGVWMIDADTCK